MRDRAGRMWSDTLRRGSSTGAVTTSRTAKAGRCQRPPARTTSRSGCPWPTPPHRTAASSRASILVPPTRPLSPKSQTDAPGARPQRPMRPESEVGRILTVDIRDPAREDSAAGDFTLVRELGRGASSVVHLAWQRSLDRDVALKRLLRTLSADASATERLRREAQVVSRLDHPRIVRLYDLITDGADLVLVMEYVQGPSVQSMAATARPSASQAPAV